MKNTFLLAATVFVAATSWRIELPSNTQTSHSLNAVHDDTSLVLSDGRTLQDMPGKLLSATQCDAITSHIAPLIDRLSNDHDWHTEMKMGAPDELVFSLAKILGDALSDQRHIANLGLTRKGEYDATVPAPALHIEMHHISQEPAVIF